MTCWLQRAITEGACFSRVPIVPLVPGQVPTAAIGTNGTAGTPSVSWVECVRR
jgi:hypothetical protein